jgi:RimJ/RimL family protein N-acetyltransferase
MSVDDRLRERLDAARVLAIPIKELVASDRPLVLHHLTSLGPEDRYLRFGNPVGDSVIADYVERIKFDRDTVFGVFDDRLELVAMGHFARMPDSEPVADVATGVAEFGLSVSESARGQGIGTALFVRAATHARNLGVAILFMHCLAQNRAMMRIARKAGMEVTLDHGEADAYLKLEPADAASVMREAAQKQIALVDYAFKQQRAGARRFVMADAGS